MVATRLVAFNVMREIISGATISGRIRDVSPLLVSTEGTYLAVQPKEATI